MLNLTLLMGFVESNAFSVSNVESNAFNGWETNITNFIDAYFILFS